MQKQLLVAVTNRSSYNKIKPIVRNLPDDVNPSFLLGGGVLLYRFGGIEHIIEKDFPNAYIHKIHLAVEGDDLSKMGKTVGLGIIEVSQVLEFSRPDAVLVCADRFETLAISVASSYNNIPLIHLQGGENTGTIDNKVRNANSVLSDIHFPATEMSGIRLGRMITSEHIYPYGCPSMDLLIADPDMKSVRDKELAQGKAHVVFNEWCRIIMKANNSVNSKGTGSGIQCGKPFIIVMLHGDTTDYNFVRNMHGLTDALDMIDIQKIIFWNNIDPKGDLIAKMWREYSSRTVCKHKFIRHLEPEDFSRLLLLSDCIVGNSSTGIREASFLGVPSINIGDRQHGREHGQNVLSVPFSKCAIYDGILSRRGKYYLPSNLYGRGNAGQLIAGRISHVLWNRP